MNYAKRYSYVALLCAFLPLFLPAQNILITYTKSDSLFVCNTDTFSVKIQNNLPAALSGAQLTVGLPAGLSYLPGSVSGASQQNISNLMAPVLGLPDIPANQSVIVKFILSADCDAADVLDAGQLFIANLSVNSPQGNAQVSTTSIPVETGAIIIQSVTGQVLMGERDDTLLRTICVKNTRLGKIGSLFFEDDHLDGFFVSITGANSQMNTPLTFNAEFGGAFFNSVGNGDQWLDLDETVCFTEKIVLTSCGTPAFTNPSVLRVGWGCGGSICRYDSSTALIEIKPSTKIPDLVFEQIWSPPTDYCGGTPAVMGYKIVNQGKADAKNVVLDLSLIQGLTKAGILGNSFRIEHNNGSTPIASNSSTPDILPACGLNVVRKALFSIPLVPAKDSIKFLFDVITCVEQCDGVQPAFRADYFYQKECPINGFVSANDSILPPDGYEVNGELQSLNSSCFLPGTSYPFSYEIKSKYLSEDGFVHIKLNLPPGFTIDTACGILLGNTAPVLFENNTSAIGESTVHLAWATPLPADLMLMNFCLHVECDTNISCFINTSDSIIYTDYCCIQASKNAAYWTQALNTPQHCGINDCETRFLAIDRMACALEPGDNGGDTSFIDPAFPLVLHDWFNVYRLNLGYLDQDDDRQADNLSPASINAIRRDRFLAGDTLRVEYCGVIDSGFLTIDTITRAIWHEIVGSDMGSNDNDIFSTSKAKNTFADSSKFRYLKNTFRIRYADGTIVDCDWNGLVYGNDKNYFQVANPNTFPPVPIDDIATEKFYFLYPLTTMFADGCLPKPYIEAGDSIFINTDFKLDLNFKPKSNNDPDPPLIGFRTATSPGGLLYAWNIQPRKNLQYSGWIKEISPNIHSIKPCESSLEPKKFRYSMRIARENMFPFEVRPLAQITDYQQTVPPGLELASANLDYLTLQDSVLYLNNVSLPFSETPGSLDLDFGPAFNMPVDEGFTLRTSLTFKPNCQFNLPDTSKQYIETSFTGCLNGDKMTLLDSIKNGIGFFANTPKLRLLTSDTNIYSPSRLFEVDFDLKNLVVSGAQAAWVAVVSPSGQASNYQLYQMPQNQPINGVNGFFNVGTINGFSLKSFRLKGEELSCETDSLYLIFGWSCAPISSLAEAGCGQDTTLIQIHLERPELELDIIQEPDVLTLCDTSEYFEFEVYNAKIGYAYDLQASVKLPPGLVVVPGTCQIAYPVGAAWANISDPALLPGNLFLWEINNLLPALATNGLPGVNLDPQNTFRIRFKTLAQCGFVANSPIIYGTTGVESCGRKSNLLNKPGDPLTINGLNPTYGVQVSLQPVGTPGTACGTAQEFSVTLNLLGTPSPGDSVYILLPQGLTYIDGSYTPGANAPSGPVTQTAQGFQLPLPILQGGGTLMFGFKVNLGAASGCNDQVILAQARVRTEAFCQSLGAPCDVFISTGEAAWNLSVPHPLLTASNPVLSIVNGQINGTISLSNIGNQLADGATVQIWKDLDGNGVPSAGDVLLQTLQSFSQILPGGTTQISGILNGLDSNQLCGILIVLPADLNCGCSDEVFPINISNLQHTPLILCGLQPVNLGVTAQAGFSYQWQPAALLACATCANTVFNPDASTPPNTTQTLTLTEKSNGCVITHQFDITFGAVATIVVANSTICEGSSTVLTANPPGNSYLWQGPGIQNPTQASQTVKPGVSSNYSVTVSFANGCTATAATAINVLNADTIQLSGLSTCAGEPVSVLGNLTATPGTYQLVLKKLNGCDSTIQQVLNVFPEFQTEEERVFCQGDSLPVFDSVYTESGTYLLSYSTIHGCDSIHTIHVTEKDPLILTPVDTIYGSFGQIITLTGPNGYTTYHWEPAPTPPCPNCPSVTYPADSTGYYEYLLTVGDEDGCPGELLFRVVVAPPCSPDSLHIPNAFTPNGDGNNDVFRVVPYEGSEVISSLEIYDRWGEKVYENKGNSGWDGTIDGKPGSSDVYVYIVTVNCGKLIGKRVGDVTLLR